MKSLVLIIWLLLTSVWVVLFQYCYRMIQDIRSGEYRIPLIRQVIVKYDDCRKLDIDINNVGIFVEKTLKKYKLCGLSMDVWVKCAHMSECIMPLAGTACILLDILMHIVENVSMDGGLGGVLVQAWGYVQGGQHVLGREYVLIVEVLLFTVILHMLELLWQKKIPIIIVISELTEYLESCGEDKQLNS